MEFKAAILVRGEKTKTNHNSHYNAAVQLEEEMKERTAKYCLQEFIF